MRITKSQALDLYLARGSEQQLYVAQLSAPNGESGDIDRIQIVEANSGLIGILVPTKVFYIYSDRVPSARRTWTRYVLADHLACVVDPQARTYWKSNVESGQDSDDNLRNRLVDELTAAGSDDPRVLKGVDYAHLAGDAARPSVLASLGVFPDLRSISIEEMQLTPTTIDEIRSLKNLRSLWLDYIEYDAEILADLGRLNNLTGLYLRESDLAQVCGADELIDKLRELLPQTEVRVRDSD